MKNLLKEVAVILTLMVVVIIAGCVVIYLRDTHDEKAYATALANGMQPLESGVYVLSFSKTKNLVVVPASLIGCDEDVFYRVSKEKGVMCVITNEGFVNKPRKMLRKGLMKKLLISEPDEQGLYRFYDDYFGAYIVALPYQMQSGLRLLSDKPEDIAFFRTLDFEVPVALITDAGDIVKL